MNAPTRQNRPERIRGTLSLALKSRGDRETPPPARKTREERATENRETLDLLVRTFPKVFRTRGHRAPPPLPLALGIDRMILDRMGGAMTRKRLERAMFLYTNNARYLRALATPGALRHDLDGAPVTPVTDRDRVRAMEMLADIERHRRPAKR